MTIRKDIDIFRPDSREDWQMSEMRYQRLFEVASDGVEALDYLFSTGTDEGNNAKLLPD